MKPVVARASKNLGACRLGAAGFQLHFDVQDTEKRRLQVAEQLQIVLRVQFGICARIEPYTDLGE